MPLFTKRIIKPGTYTVPRSDGTSARVHIGPQRIKRWTATFEQMRSMGLGIPAPWRHDDRALPVRLDGDRMDTDAYNNAGFWKRLWVDDKDGSLYGEVEIPRDDDADRLGRTVVDVSLLAKPRWTDGQGNAYEDALTHIALVTHPVAPDGENTFTRSPEAISCSLGDLIMADAPEAKPADPAPAPAPVSATAATVGDAIKLLGSLETPIVLPDDTTEENFLERLVVALNAIRGTQNQDGTDLSVQPSNAQERPGPIAMSTEHSDPKADAALKFATNTIRASYASRVDAAVKSGRITPKYAKEKLTPMVEELALSFDAEGNPTETPLDLILQACEAIPSNSLLRSKGTGLETRFSQAADLMEVHNPAEQDTDGDLVMSDDEVDAFVEDQFKAGGYSAERVEGGYRKR